jgi:hypothetical protein
MQTLASGLVALGLALTPLGVLVMSQPRSVETVTVTCTDHDCAHSARGGISGGGAAIKPRG